MWDTLIFFERTMISADGGQRVDIAVAEDERTAARLDAQGYRRCSYAEFRVAWRMRDELAYAQEVAELPPPPAPVVVQHTPAKHMRGARIYPAPAV